MKSVSTSPESIDEYINLFSKEVQIILNSLKIAIKSAAPNATEKISYKIPTFYLNGNLVHFAAYKNHIGFYPTSSGISEFQDKLTEYKISKGTIQFPLDKPIPYELVREIVSYRVRENTSKK